MFETVQMMSFHEILTTLTHEQTHIDIRTHADFNCIAHNFFAITYSILFVRLKKFGGKRHKGQLNANSNQHLIDANDYVCKQHLL